MFIRTFHSPVSVLSWVLYSYLQNRHASAIYRSRYHSVNRCLIAPFLGRQRHAAKVLDSHENTGGCVPQWDFPRCGPVSRAASRNRSGSPNRSENRATSGGNLTIPEASKPEPCGDPYGTRTRVFAVRGRRPGPLDEGASASRAGHMWARPSLVKSVELVEPVGRQVLRSRSLRKRISSASVDSIWSCICVTSSFSRMPTWSSGLE